MDSNRFDEITKFVGAETSRRGILSGTLRGSIAALLAAAGISAFDVETAEAVNCGKKCRKRKKAGKKRCLRACRRGNRRRARARRRRASQRLSTPIGVGPVQIGGACTSSAQCASGFCSPTLGVCQECAGIQLCGTRCCTVTASCIAGLCVAL